MCQSTTISCVVCGDLFDSVGNTACDGCLSQLCANSDGLMQGYEVVTNTCVRCGDLFPADVAFSLCPGCVAEEHPPLPESAGTEAEIYAWWRDAR